MSDLIQIEHKGGHLSTLKLEKGGYLRVIGVLPHGASWKPATSDDRHRLLLWLEGEFTPDMASAKPGQTFALTSPGGEA